MTWTKAVIFAVLIVTAIIVAIHYRKLAGAVVCRARRAAVVRC